MQKKLIQSVMLLWIITLAAFFRFYNINWDQGQHLHPDERFLTMVVEAIQWPPSWNVFFDTGSSPLNPHNVGHTFFVYGTLPLFIVKWIAQAVGSHDYGGITLVGRTVSGLFDLGTVALVYLIANQLESRKWKVESGTEKNTNLLSTLYSPFSILAAFFYACTVLSIQLSHFFAVDTFLTFFITASFYILINIVSLHKESTFSFLLSTFSIILGLFFGFALASKISAMYFAPIIGLGFLISFLKNKALIRKKLIFFTVAGIFFLLATYIALRLSYPYLFAGPRFLSFTLNPKVLENWSQLESFNDPNSLFPPGIQWINTKPYIFPLKNMLFWGLGLPLGIAAIGGVLYSIVTLLHCSISTLFKNKNQQSNNLTIETILNNNLTVGLTLISLWVVILFTYQGTQFVKALRYFHPIYPFLTIIAAFFTVQALMYMNKFTQKNSKFSNSIICLLAYSFIGLIILIYPTSFLSIYSHPHSRIAASNWLYDHIPTGSVLSAEHWDDPQPMNFPEPNKQSSRYVQLEYPLYHPDNADKWNTMLSNLERTEYIIMTSNRLYGAIMTVPEKFPITSRYYKALFDGSLGFEKIQEFSSRPNLPIPFFSICLTPPGARYGIIAKPTQYCSLPGLSFVDDYADETFTVYDHPVVLIFKKVKPVDYRLLLNL